jgi:hypothetical protein
MLIAMPLAVADMTNSRREILIVPRPFIAQTASCTAYVPLSMLGFQGKIGQRLAPAPGVIHVCH